MNTKAWKFYGYFFLALAMISLAFYPLGETFTFTLSMVSLMLSLSAHAWIAALHPKKKKEA